MSREKTQPQALLLPLKPQEEKVGVEVGVLVGVPLQMEEEELAAAPRLQPPGPQRRNLSAWRHVMTEGVRVGASRRRNDGVTILKTTTTAPTLSRIRMNPNQNQQPRTVGRQMKTMILKPNVSHHNYS